MERKELTRFVDFQLKGKPAFDLLGYCWTEGGSIALVHASEGGRAEVSECLRATDPMYIIRARGYAYSEESHKIPLCRRTFDVVYLRGALVHLSYWPTDFNCPEDFEKISCNVSIYADNNEVAEKARLVLEEIITKRK